MRFRLRQVVLYNSLTEPHTEQLLNLLNANYLTVSLYWSLQLLLSVILSWLLHVLPRWRLLTTENPRRQRQTSLGLSLLLRPTVSRPVCLGIKHPSGAYDHIFITVRQLRICWCGALSLTRGRVCRLKLLLALTSAVIFGSEPRGTHDHILLSQIRDFPFRLLLRLAGLRWRYSTPPTYGVR
jgi:hypothetical protein